VEEEEEWSSLNICLEDAEGATYFAGKASFSFHVSL
jgi:hypothetical protein